MKLKSEYVTYPLDDREIMVGTGESSFKGLVKMNVSAAYIISCLREDIDAEGIVKKMLERYDAKREDLEADVNHVIEVLRSIGALDE